MWKFILSSIVIIMTFTSNIYAAPSINPVPGTYQWSHKAEIIITGSGFGTKSPAAPVKWDDGEDKTTDSFSVLAAEYADANPGRFPGCPDPWKIQYRNAPYTAVSTPVNAPHSNSAKFIVGGHHEDYDINHSARDVQITAADPSGPKDRWFATWYYTIDPAWPACGTSPNHKIITIQSGTQAYGDAEFVNQYFYMSFTQNPCQKLDYTAITAMGTFGTPWCGEWYPNPSACNSSTARGDNDGSGWRGNSPSDGNWVRLETRISDDQGFLTFLIDNALTWHGDGRPGWVPEYTAVDSGIRSFTVGGYYRNDYDSSSNVVAQHSDAFRYFDDIYIDSTLARVMLANNSNYDSATILEPQIPSAWGTGSISFTVNLGKFSQGETAYLFVFDADNNHNPTGYPVTIGGSAQTEEPLGVPSNLDVTVQ